MSADQHLLSVGRARFLIFDLPARRDAQLHRRMPEASVQLLQTDIRIRCARCREASRSRVLIFMPTPRPPPYECLPCILVADIKAMVLGLCDPEFARGKGALCGKYQVAPSERRPPFWFESPANKEYILILNPPPLMLS